MMISFWKKRIFLVHCLVAVAYFSFVCSTVNADIAQPGATQLFGIAAAYNDVFFKPADSAAPGDATYKAYGGDSEGHVAVRGNVDVQSHSFGAFRGEKHPSGPVLVVGGNVTASGTSVYDGDAHIGGKLIPKGGNPWDSLGARGDLANTDPGYVGKTGTIYAEAASLPFDFTVAKDQLHSVSTDLYGLGETTSGSFDASGNYRIDLAASGLQSVVVDAAVFKQLSDSGKNLFVTGGADTTLILNVTDDMGLGLLDLSREIYINGRNDQFYGDFDGSNLLINANVADVYSAAANINASILALDAHFDLLGGHISGQVFGDSVNLVGGAELHAYYTFDDQHFQGAGVPEPASMLIVGTGLAGLALALRKREKRAGTCGPGVA